MTISLGSFTVDTAEGILRPALGITAIPNPSPPPDDIPDYSQAGGTESKITTARAFASAALALAEAQAYRGAVGTILTFRGVWCFVANVVPDHQAAKVEGGSASATAVWTLVADPTWTP